MTSRSIVSLKVLGAVAVGVLVTAVALCSRAHAQQTGIADSSGPLQQRPREVRTPATAPSDGSFTFADEAGSPVFPTNAVEIIERSYFGSWTNCENNLGPRNRRNRRTKSRLQCG